MDSDWEQALYFSRGPSPAPRSPSANGFRSSTGSRSSSPPVPPPGSPLRIPRRSSSHSHTFTITSQGERKPLFLPPGNGNTVHRDSSITPPPHPPGRVPGLDRMNRPIGKKSDGSTRNGGAAAATTAAATTAAATTAATNTTTAAASTSANPTITTTSSSLSSSAKSTSYLPVPVNSFKKTPSATPHGTPSKSASLSQRRSFSGSAPPSSTAAPMSRLKKRSSGFNLKKAWQMAGDEDHAANLLVDSPSPAPRPPSTIPVFRREIDSATATTTTATATATRSLASSKSSIASEEYRSLGDSATTAATSVMKGSQLLDDNNDGEKKLTSKRSIFGMGAMKARPRSGDAEAELNAASPQTSAGSGQSPPSSIHSGSSHNKDNSPKERLRDWGSKVASKTPLLRRFRSTAADERDKDRDSRRKSGGWFSSTSNHDPSTGLPAIEAGVATQELLDSSPISRPGSGPDESPNKSYNWQVEEDFTAGSLMVSDSPMLKFKQASERYSQPDFTGAGEDDAATSPSSARRVSLGRTNTKIDEISQREMDADAAIPVADPAAPRPKNTKLDDIRQREIDGITARTVANLRLEEMRELNSKARTEAPAEGKSFRERSGSAASSTQYQRPHSRLERTSEENLVPGVNTIEPQPPTLMPAIDRVASRSSLVPPSAGARKSASGTSLRDKAAMVGSADTAPENISRAVSVPPVEPAARANAMENTHGGQSAAIRRLSWTSIPGGGDVAAAGANPAAAPIAPSGSDGPTTSAPSAVGAGIKRSTTPTSNPPTFNPPIFSPHPTNKPNANFFSSKAETVEQADDNTNVDDGAAPASLAKSKLPTRATSFYSSLNNNNNNSTKNANPNALHRTVSSSYDRTKLATTASVPLPPETTTTTISSDTASSHPPGNGESSHLRSVRSLRSLESIRNRARHGRKMDDDPTNRIEGERSLFAPGNSDWELHSDRGSMRSPSPAPIIESEDEDEEEAAVMLKSKPKAMDKEKVDEKMDDDEKTYDNDATPRPKKTHDILAMTATPKIATPKIVGAFVETPATVKQEKIEDESADEEEEEFRPRKLDFRTKPSPLSRQPSATGKSGGLGPATVAAAAAAAAGFKIGATAGSAVGAVSSVSETVRRVPISTRPPLGTDLFRGERKPSVGSAYSSSNPSGAESDPESSESTRQARETKAAIKRRARSLSRRRSSIPSVHPPTVQDDLAELNRMHHVEDSGADTTLDDFEREGGAGPPSFASSFSSDTFDKMLAGMSTGNIDAVDDDDEADMEKWEKVEYEKAESVKSHGSKGKGKEAAHNDTDEDEDDTQTQAETIARLARRLSMATLPGIRDARRGLTKLEGQVSSPDADEQVERPRTPENKPIMQQPAWGEKPIKQEKAEAKPETISAVQAKPVAVPKKRSTKSKRSWFAMFCMLILLALAWYGAETAVCNRYCRPVACDTDVCVWDPSDPTFGNALPVKLDEWVTDGMAGDLYNRASDAVTDVWDSILGRQSEAYVVGKGFSSRRRVARRMRKRASSNNITDARGSSNSGGYDEEQRQRWRSWNLARQARDRQIQEEARVEELLG